MEKLSKVENFIIGFNLNFETCTGISSERLSGNS